mgnify:CR=1 FL=1
MTICKNKIEAKISKLEKVLANATPSEIEQSILDANNMKKFFEDLGNGLNVNKIDLASLNTDLSDATNELDKLKQTLKLTQ